MVRGPDLEINKLVPKSNTEHNYVHTISIRVDRHAHTHIKVGSVMYLVIYKYVHYTRIHDPRIHVYYTELYI